MVDPNSRGRAPATGFSVPPADLGSGPAGLTVDEAAERVTAGVGERLRTHRQFGAVRLFLAQFKSPITLILMFSAVLSLAVADRTDAAIIMLIILAGAGLGFWQEYRAATSMQKLLAIVSTRAKVLRSGRELTCRAKRSFRETSCSWPPAT